MQRYKTIIEYCGTNYHGMQQQSNYKTIQGELEVALFKLFQKDIRIEYSGRTDAGVHAIGQVIHFDVETKVECFKIKDALNFYLINEQISVINIEKVDFNFHARFSSKERIYLYKIINRKAKITFQDKLFLHVPQKLNINKLKIAASYLKGMYDFSSFRSIECQALDPVKTINNIEIIQIADEINIYFYAKSYLHNMIRIIVGTLIEIGKEKYLPEKIIEILNAKDRKKAFATADSSGLYFLKVIY